MTAEYQMPDLVQDGNRKAYGLYCIIFLIAKNHGLGEHDKNRHKVVEVSIRHSNIKHCGICKTFCTCFATV